MAEEDIIFGKNRHFFGGIEPSNMNVFSAYAVDGVVKITAEPPADTIVNGQTLVSVAGAVIRRKTTDYPVSEFDGDPVVTIAGPSTFIDYDADPNSTYFYAAFPFSTQGVYSTSQSMVNRTGINIPEPMVEFTATATAGKVTLNAILPESAAGAVIRRSPGTYPLNETDGEEVMTITESGKYVDSGVTSEITYYYAAFPYNAAGAYNRDVTNRLSIYVVPFWYYGYDINLADANPNTRVSYPADVENAAYAPAYMDFSAGAFNYGGWNLAPGEKFMPKPCMLTVAGVVDQYLDPNDYTKKEDGTASDVANTSFNGNAMMEWPKIYTKRWEENGIYHFRCSDGKLDDDYECWCNYDRNNNEIDHFYTSIYPAYNRSSKFASISGQTIHSPSSGAASNYVPSYATKVGTDWYIDTAADWLLITDLLVMMARTTDCNSAYGKFGHDMNKKMTQTGLRNTDGMFYGANPSDNNDQTIIKVFGMEQWFGKRRFVAGWIVTSLVQYIKMTRGTKDGSTATDYNTTGSGYITVSGANIVKSTGQYGDYSGYVSACKTTPYGRIPYAAQGSSTTYEADQMFYDIDGSSAHYVSIGGEGTYCGGPFSVLASGGLSSAMNNYIYAGLSCKPSAT